MQTSPPPSSPDIAQPPRRLRSLLAQHRRAQGRRGFGEEPAGPRLEAARPKLSLASKVLHPSGFNAGMRPTLHTCEKASQALCLSYAVASVLLIRCKPVA